MGATVSRHGLLTPDGYPRAAAKDLAVPSSAPASSDSTPKKHLVTKLRAKNGRILNRTDLVGQKVRVMWGSTWYRGTIAEYKPEEQYKWQIHYEDDDREWGIFSEDFRFHFTERARRPVEWLSATPLLVEENFSEPQQATKQEHIVLVSVYTGKDVNHDSLLNEQLKVLWTNNRWYHARVVEYRPWNPQYKWYLHYEDGDKEWGDWSEDWGTFKTEGADRRAYWLTARRVIRKGPPPPHVTITPLAKAAPEVAKALDQAVLDIVTNSRVVVINRDNSQKLGDFAKRISLFMQYKVGETPAKMMAEPQSCIQVLQAVSVFLDGFSRKNWLQNLEYSGGDMQQFQARSRYLMQTFQVWMDATSVVRDEAISLPVYNDETSNIRRTVCELGGSDVCANAIKTLRDQERLAELSSVITIDTTTIDASVVEMDFGPQQTEVEGLLALPRMPLALKQFWLGCFNKQTVVWSVFYRNLITALGDQVDVLVGLLKQYDNNDTAFETVILRGLDVNRVDNEVTVEEFHQFYEVCAALSDKPITNLERCCSTLVEKVGEQLLSEEHSSLMHVAAAAGYHKVIEVLLNHEVDIETTIMDSMTPLHMAAKNGQLECVRLLLQRGADIEARNEDAWTPMMYACASEEPATLDVIKLLLAEGADLEAQSENGSSPVMFAAYHGSDEAVRVLLDKKVNIDSQNKDGFNPLLYAAEMEKPKMVELLVARGAKLTVKDKDGWTALHWAAHAGSLDIIKLLVDRKIDMEAKTEDGRTPLFLAAQSGNSDAVDYLLSRTANLSTVDAKGMTPLMAAIDQGGDDVSVLLVLRGASIEDKDKDEWTPLHYAANNGSENIVRVLLEKGAEADAPDRYGRTPLMLAMSQTPNEAVIKLLLDNKADVNKEAPETGSTALTTLLNRWEVEEEWVKLLLDAGADVNHKCKDGNTPLLLACTNGSWPSWFPILDMLLANGADVRAKDVDGQTAVTKAMGSKELLLRLLDSGADINGRASDGDTVIMRAVWEDWEDLFKRLVDSGADLTRKNNYGQNVLSFVAYHGRAENYLMPILARGLDVDFPWFEEAREMAHDADVWVGYNAYTPMQLAAERGNHDTVKLFLEAGAKIEAQNEDGYTAMHLAAQNGNGKVIEVLLDKGAKIDAVGKDGSTALHLAASAGYIDVVELLLTKGAQINLADADGETALHVAAGNGQLAVVDLLISKGASVSTVTKSGKTPLMLAKEAGKQDVVSRISTRM